jgi:hypothetical protein
MICRIVRALIMKFVCYDKSLKCNAAFTNALLWESEYKNMFTLKGYIYILVSLI